jgi:hypothetical protein
MSFSYLFIKFTSQLSADVYDFRRVKNVISNSTEIILLPLNMQQNHIGFLLADSKFRFIYKGLIYKYVRERLIYKNVT